MSITKRHTIFWVLVFIIWTFLKSGGGAYLNTYTLVNFVNLPIYMLAFYGLKHVQIPFLFDQNKKVLFILSLLFSSLLFYIIWRIFGVIWLDDLRGFENAGFVKFYDYVLQTIQFYSPGILLLAWEMHEDRITELQRIQELEKQKLKTELKFLKAQLNPHFLFNTFNNLYSQVINNDPNAPKMILQLSSILDYILYKSQNATVSLEEEIEVIEKYIALEQTRYGDRLSVDFDYHGDMGSQISPLLVLSLVENAFKHGASGDIENPRIKISINANEPEMVCRIWNTKSAYEGELNDAYKKGIGLSNVKRQLELSYPNKYELEILDQEKDYEVILKLMLKA